MSEDREKKECVTFKCLSCGAIETADQKEYHRVAKEICRGNYVPLKLLDGKETMYVRGMDGFRCPNCGNVMFLRMGN